MKKVLFCGYRSWALKAYDRLNEKFKQQVEFVLCQSQDELKELLSQSKYDFCALVGWSWIIEDEELSKCPFFCIHPSDLPDYRGGSPLQHQIIDGITKTKCTLLQINQKIDAGDIVFKVPFSLEGEIKDIFDDLTNCSVSLLEKLFQAYPDFPRIPQDLSGGVKKRRTPKDSQLDPKIFQGDNLRLAYNIIRGLGDPYPNAYIKNKKGEKLIFKSVRYEADKQDTKDR